MILIVGGSGTLGSLVARGALDSGQSVRLMTRSPAKVESLRAAGADVVEGDLLDQASLLRACDGATAVVAAAHSILGRGRSASVHVDGAGNRHLIDAAKAQAVGRFVFLSVSQPSLAYRSIPFFRIKHEVEQYLEATGVRHTILRPTAFMDLHAHVLIGEPVLKKGKVAVFGPGERPRNFVAASDVARLTLLALRDESPADETIEVGGPENLSSMDVVRLYERLGGRNARVTHVPLIVPRAASVVLRPFHPGLSQIMQAAVLGETVDQTFDSRALATRLGGPLTTLEEWAGRRLARAPA